MRVLVVGNANERHFGAKSNNVERKLANGFIRNDHYVYFFSDRDVARTGTIFRSSRAGRGVANANFLKVVREFAPDLVVFTHSSLITTQTFGEAKALRPSMRLAQVCVDALFNTSNADFLVDRADIADATFLTTGGQVLARFSRPGRPVSYMPNPVDSSIETGRGFERSDQAHDVFWAARAGQGDHSADPRVVFPLHLARSGEVSVDYHGIDGRPQLFGAAYFPRLCDARMALNLNSDRFKGRAEPAPAEQLYLYNSDRIAQVLGCGLLALSMRTNSLGELFEENREMAFGDTPDEMLETVLRYKRDDAARRRVAEAGWRKAHAELNERLVARYIEEVAFGRPLSHAYIWPTQLW